MMTAVYCQCFVASDVVCMVDVALLHHSYETFVYQCLSYHTFPNCLEAFPTCFVVFDVSFKVFQRNAMCLKICWVYPVMFLLVLQMCSSNLVLIKYISVVYMIFIFSFR
jgi:hypothetical protein